MRSSSPLFVLSALLFSCGGKVIFDTNPGTGGAGGTVSSTAYVGATTSKATSTNVVSVAVSTGVTTVGVTTGTGGSCIDPGAPPGSTIGMGDCGGMPCNSASKCSQVCSALYDCGLAKCGPGGTKLCPGFSNTAMQHDAFIANTMGPGGSCMQNCMQTPQFKTLVDPTDCQATVSTLKGLSMGFYYLCNGATGG